MQKKKKKKDAFSIGWFYLKFFAFPPISVISRVLSKVKQSLLVLPQTPNKIHLWKKMSMLVIHLSGSLQKASHFQGCS